MMAICRAVDFRYAACRFHDVLTALRHAMPYYAPSCYAVTLCLPMPYDAIIRDGCATLHDYYAAYACRQRERRASRLI